MHKHLLILFAGAVFQLSSAITVPLHKQPILKVLMEQPFHPQGGQGAR